MRCVAPSIWPAPCTYIGLTRGWAGVCECSAQPSAERQLMLDAVDRQLASSMELLVERSPAGQEIAPVARPSLEEHWAQASQDSGHVPRSPSGVLAGPGSARTTTADSATSDVPVVAVPASGAARNTAASGPEGGYQ